MTKPLKVYPNPWGINPLSLKGGGQSDHGLDKYGNPCNTLPTEPDGTPVMRYVGARINADKTVVFDENRVKAPKDLRLNLNDYALSSPPQKTVWEFLGVAADEADFCKQFAAKEPVEVPASHYYLHELKAGMLLPGDGYTARMAGYAFRPDQFHLLEAYARKLANWEDTTEPPNALGDAGAIKAPPNKARASNTEGS